VLPQRRRLRADHPDQRVLAHLARRLWKPLLLAALAVGAANAEPSLDQIEHQIEVQSARLEKIVEQYNKVTEQLKASQAAATATLARIGPLKADLDLARARVAALAAQAYKGASLAKASAVLGSSDTSVLVDRLVTLNEISKYEQSQFAALDAAKGRYDGQMAHLSDLIADQSTKRGELADQKKKINNDLAKLYELRRKVGRTIASRPTSTQGVSAPYVAGKAGVAVRYAYGALGKPYEWAADGPSSYDCSGLTMAAWRAAGVALPHNAEMQWNSMPHISRSSLKPGDLVFYSGLGHVAIYVGSGKIIQAPTFGEVVQVANVDMMTPYGYGRPG
jgi:cell wall-associated NlpC family hydrolase